MDRYVFRDGQTVPDLERDQAQQAADIPVESQSLSRTSTRQSWNTLQKISSRTSTAASTESSSLNTPTSSKSTLNASTDSHVLAEADHDEKGAAQENHGEVEVRDLGWNEHPKDVPYPLVGGLPNEELWLLVRRFNKVDYISPIRRHGGCMTMTGADNRCLANVSRKSHQGEAVGRSGSKHR